jgi:hypothetical protein
MTLQNALQQQRLQHLLHQLPLQQFPHNRMLRVLRHHHLPGHLWLALALKAEMSVKQLRRTCKGMAAARMIAGLFHCRKIQDRCSLWRDRSGADLQLRTIELTFVLATAPVFSRAHCTQACTTRRTCTSVAASNTCSSSCCKQFWSPRYVCRNTA